MAVMLDGHLARHVDRGLAIRLADVARARVQHDPDGVGFVEAQLDEVVTTTKGSDLVPNTLVIKLTDAVHDAQSLISVVQFVSLALQGESEQTVVMSADRLVVRRKPDRYARLDRRADHA